MEKTRPDWLISAISTSLLGNVTPNLRAIAAKYDGSKNLTLRFYYSASVENSDEEGMEDAIGEFESAEATHRVKKIEIERVVTDQPIGELDYLHYFLFLRREH